jgi:hypothetical protein
VPLLLRGVINIDFITDVKLYCLCSNYSVVQKYGTYALVGKSFLWGATLLSAIFRREVTAFIPKGLESGQEFTIGTLYPRK